MDAIPEQLISGLAERYELRGVVGRGGMATVYWATDRKHDREVAIKVLRPELAANLGTERFLQEIALAAQLQHPHILMLIDSGQTGDWLYYVMPLVEGGSLRVRLDEGRLSLEETLDIVERVADALAYAHELGVVHRDIKPENILFSRGYAVVGDFGIAKAVSTAGGGSLTRTGFAVGTVGYMSPEQAAGSKAIGPSSDVYSLACVTYEMLVGEVPGLWPSDEESDAGRFADLPEAHRAALDDLPRHVEPALARALARQPGNRLRDPRAFLSALRGKHPVPPVVREAARSSGAPALVVTQPASPTGFLSLPSHLEVATTVAGEVPASAFGNLLLELQAHTGDVGQAQESMGTFAWHNATWESGGINVTVCPADGETTLRVRERTGPYKVVTTLVSIVGGGVATFFIVAFADEGGLIVANLRILAGLGAVVMPSAIVGGRLVLRNYLRSRRQKLAGLLRRLADIARGSIG